MTAHSRAEVYRLETIERHLRRRWTQLEPKTLASAGPDDAHQPRDGLARPGRPGRRPRPTVASKDIQAEVLRGYDLAHATRGPRSRQHTESWELLLARAALEHDENNYLHELAKDSEFTARRQEAFELLSPRRRALYAAAVVDARAGRGVEPRSTSCGSTPRSGPAT